MLLMVHQLFTKKGKGMVLKKFAGIGLVIATASLFPNGIVFSQEDAAASEDNAAVMDELSLGDILSMKITTGSFLELDLTKSPLSMTVITKDMVRNSAARHMSELLEIYVPGFIYNINKYYGNVWAMRGISNDRNTKVIYLVNGHKMNTQAREGFQGETSLGLLGDIERVEVLRGPAGLVYGSGAIAGIVNVVTKKAEDAKSNVQVVGALDGSKSIEANLYGKPNDDASFAITAGFKQSDGLPLGMTRIYPTGNKGASLGSPTNMGVPSDGRYGSTDGNWKFGGELNYKAFNLFFRATRQKDNSASYFMLYPWADQFNAGTKDSTWSVREVDGKNVAWNDPFWKGRNNYRSSMKQYLSDNISSEASYKFSLAENELTTKFSFDMNTSSILEEKLEHYENDNQYKNGRSVNTWGERRYMLSAVYLLKSIEKLQAAFGIEDRIDDIGNNINGKNYQLWNSLHYSVKNIVYNTFAVFGEGFYDFTDVVGVHAGLRLDWHTRAIFLSPKIAAIIRPSENHSIKVIYQSAANNGTAENYEFNKNHVNDKGEVVTTPTLQNSKETPKVTSGLVQPAEEEEMHKLKPERVHSWELSYVGKLFESLNIEVSPSINLVRDLFVWEQSLFRVINVGNYTSGNLDVGLNYSHKYFKVGANHAIQRPIFTDVDKQKKTFQLYQLEDSVINGQTVYGKFVGFTPSGDSSFVPFYSKSKNVDVNLVQKSITFDGKEFLNIPQNMTKIYAEITPFEWLSLSTNLRMIWGFGGRDPVIDSFGDTCTYFGYFGEKEPSNLKDYIKNMVSKKWNASLSLYLPGDFDATFTIYNILGTDAHDFFQKKVDKNAVNTFRVQHMFDFANREAFSVDQRTFGLTLTKSF
jgi:outer membrane receptor protein involved in Fe transport